VTSQCILVHIDGVVYCVHWGEGTTDRGALDLVLGAGDRVGV